MNENDSQFDEPTSVDDLPAGDFHAPEDVISEVAVDEEVTLDEGLDSSEKPETSVADDAEQGRDDVCADEAADEGDDDVADVVGSDLADQLDQLIGLANATNDPSKNGGDGHTDVASAIDQLFESPEAVIGAAEGNVADDQGDANSLLEADEKTSSDSGSNLVSNSVPNSESLPKAGDDADDTDDMDASFATLEEVINEAGLEPEPAPETPNKPDEVISEDAASIVAPMDASLPGDDNAGNDQLESPEKQNASISSNAVDDDELDPIEADFESADTVLGDVDADVQSGADVEDEGEPIADAGAPAVAAMASNADSSADFNSDAGTTDESDELDASFETVEQVMDPAVEPPSVAVDTVDESVSEASPEPPAETEHFPIEQIDELLAEQADTAVAGDFETPGEILAAEQVTDSHADERDDDSFATPEDVFEAGEASETSEASEISDAGETGETIPATAAPMGSGTILEAPLLHHEDASPAGETEAIAEGLDGSLEVEMEFDATFEAIDESDPSVDDHESSDAEVESKGRLGGIVKICVDNVYRFCEITNRPLQGQSDSTRKLIGMIGLLTVANASMIILGKVVLSLLG